MHEWKVLKRAVKLYPWNHTFAIEVVTTLITHLFLITIYIKTIMSNINYVFLIYRIVLACSIMYFMANLLYIFFGQMVPHFLSHDADNQEKM